MKSIRDFKCDGTERGAEERVQDLSEKYSGMSESELMQALYSKVSDARRDGTFNDEQLDEFVGFVSPSLDDATKKRLEEIVRLIKK